MAVRASLVARCIKDDCFAISSGKAKPGFRLRGGEVIDLEVPDLIFQKLNRKISH